MKNKNQKTRTAPFVFPIDISNLKFDEKGKPEKEIQVLPTGKWNHPAYGPIIIDASDITEFKNNFDKGLRKDIPITEGHQFMEEKPAVGWFSELIDRGSQGLFATVEWTQKGITLLQEKAYKYFSPEFYSEYEDPQSREIHANVLVGGALTNKPYFKELKAVVLSEQTINKPFYQFNDNTMDIKEIAKKNVEELSEEEKSFLKDNKDQLSPEELSKFGSVFEDESGNDGDGDSKEGEGKEGKGNDNPESKEGGNDGGNNDDGGKGEGEGEPQGNDPKDPAQASEHGTVKVNAAEYAALKSMANKGAKAFDDLRQTKIKTEASELVFSEQNSQGKVLPKDEQKVFSFMLGLTEAQRKAFAEIVKGIPTSRLFGEAGSGDDGSDDGSAAGELNKKVEKAMSEDKQLQYSDAVRQVLASDKDLANRYSEENRVRK